VVLPAAGTAAAEPTAAAPAAAAHGRVLVVDDDALIGSAIRRVLPPEQEVVMELDGRVALDRVRRGEAFDLVLCDLVMPGMSGLEFHDALALASPILAARTLFMSGSQLDAATRERIARSGAACLAKPFAPALLREAVAQRLARA
jgi:CheY-like chemotaxis protein